MSQRVAIAQFDSHRAATGIAHFNDACRRRDGSRRRKHFDKLRFRFAASDTGRRCAAPDAMLQPARIDTQFAGHKRHAMLSHQAHCRRPQCVRDMGAGLTLRTPQGEALFDLIEIRA